uniref:PGG domain-containing protein n=1 Tax=Salix viminalis TaxID=40686 RepID=A0A6N2NBJ4_SALVM
MDSEEILETIYIAAMNGNWKGMVDFYKKNARYLFSPATLSRDTGLHLAVHSNTEKPLKDLLEMMQGMEFLLTQSKNKFGNTVLHEATIYGNHEAVRLLVELCPDLLKEKNNYGETPLFTAASFGEAEIVEFLFRSNRKQCVNDECRLLEIHRKISGDGLSILSAAIKGQHFETALLLLEVDGSLHSLEDEKGRTALQYLADMPSAFKSGNSMGIFETLFYCCLPVIRHHKVKLQTGGQAGQGVIRDLEIGSGSSLERNQRGGLLNYLKASKVGCWPARLERFWNQKKEHVFALRLAKMLIEKDKSWKSVSKQTGPPSSQVKQGDQNNGKEQEQGMGGGRTSVKNSSLTREERIPLFLATRNGIEEIVWETIKLHPHAVEKLNDKGQSILDVSVMHRQKKIFSLVTQQKIPLARLHRVIDYKGNTLLHHVADMEHYRGGTKPGPALKLQEELQWFEQVQEVIPSHYVTLRNNEGKTARDLFNARHKDQLENAQKWIKETTQFCSTVAAGVFTIVFAAAYTVPGGSDENGKPNFIDSPYFLVFTVSDVLSLASSLTSLVACSKNNITFMGFLSLISIDAKKAFRENMSFPLMEKPYRAAMRGDWKNIIHHYQDRSLDLRLPVTLSADTALHIAVYSKQAQPLEDLLEIVERIKHFLPDIDSPAPEEEYLSADQMKFLKRKNEFGNTALHEATICGNYEAVRLLVDQCADLLNEKNKYGETPLFTAAAFAEAEIVEFLFRSNPEQCVNDECRLLEIHRQRSGDGLSILSAAIKGQHFETALMLLELDDSLHDLKDEDGVDALKLLAHMPTAFESGVSMGIFERLIYRCLPVNRQDKLKSQLETWLKERKEQRDLESGQGRESEAPVSGTEWNQRGGILKYLKVPKGSWLERFWNQKTKHVFALKVAKILIKKDDESLNKVNITITDEEHGPGGEENGKGEITSEGNNTKESQRQEHIPLFIATINGIEEIVWEIIDQYPHAIEKLNEERQSILDVAVMHRQKKIFSLVKQQKVPLARLHRVIDYKGNTLLHHVADMEHYRGGTKPGPALKLQEELQWFEQVQEVIPSHYVTLQNKTGKTAEDLFKVSHKEQLESAQKWIKETTQSCSTVAALVATVVFAAAYTVPGGSDEEGTPNFITSPYFLVFTVSDVLSLASSLTSLVVFLSLLTSPFELKEFHFSLPRKLLFGFTFLFFAVITTMLSFGATILILIQSERKLTTLLLSVRIM